MVKKFFIFGVLSALLSYYSLPAIAAIEINSATGTIDAQFSIFNISGYPLSFKYNPDITKSSIGSKWETSIEANLQLSKDVPIFTISAYCSKILFIKNEDGKFESGGGTGAKLELINGDYILTSNIGEKLTFDDKGDLKTIQDESGSASTINRNSKNLVSGWETKSDKITTFSINKALSGRNPDSNEDSKVERNSAGEITSIKAGKLFSFIYKNSILSEIQVNSVSQYAFEYDEKGRLSRLKEPEHDYALSYYEDGRILSIDDDKGDSIYVEYKSDTTKAQNTQFVYVWNMTRFLRTEYKYTKDKIEIKEGPIDSDDVLFGTINRKTGARTMRNINGDTVDLVPEKNGNFTVNSALRGFTPYQIQVSFNNIVLKNKNGVEYYKDLMSPSDFDMEKVRSEIKNDGVIRDLNKNILEIILNGIGMMKYSYTKGDSLLEKALTSSGNELIYTYSKDGKVIQIANSLGNKTSFKYSGNNVEVIYPNGTKTNITYNDDGLPEKILDPMERKTFIDYQNTPAPQLVELCGFDTQSYVESQEDGLYSIQSNLFGLWLFVDNDDQTISRISPSGNITEYEINDNSLVTSITDSDDKKIANYSFNKYLQIIEASTDSCRIKFDYDDYGRLARKSYDKELSLAFDYDKKDVIKTINDSDGFSLKYIRDAAGKLTSITSDKTGTFKIAYYTSGLTREITYPNGVLTKWIYDVEGKITQYSILLPDGTQKNTKLNYDKIGNITQLDNEETVIRFFYDELNHLTQIADSKGKAVDLSFDIWGNLLKLGKNKSTSSSPSLFSQINLVDLTYNETSAITSYKDDDRECSVSYDWNSRLDRLQFNNGTSLKLNYSPLDNQIYSSVQNNIEIKYYILEGQIYATKDSASKKFTKFIYIPGTNICLAVIRPDGNVQYPLCDAFSSITNLTDKTGKITHSRNFNSIGLLKTTDNLNLPTGYGGLMSFDNGNILFADNGPVLLKTMRTFGPKAQEIGDISIDFTNKLSFMEIMPLVNLNEKAAIRNLGVDNR